MSLLFEGKAFEFVNSWIGNEGGVLKEEYSEEEIVGMISSSWPVSIEIDKLRIDTGEEVVMLGKKDEFWLVKMGELRLLLLFMFFMFLFVFCEYE